MYVSLKKMKFIHFGIWLYSDNVKHIWDVFGVYVWEKVDLYLDGVNDTRWV